MSLFSQPLRAPSNPKSSTILHTKHSSPRGCSTPCTAPSPRGAPGLTPWQMGSPGSTTTTTHKNQPQTWEHWLHQHQHLLLGTLGTLGITNHSQALVNRTSPTHSLGQTQFQQHIKRQNVIWGLVPRCAEEIKCPVFAAQSREWQGDMKALNQRPQLLQVHGMRLSVSSKKLQASFFNLELNYIHYLF